VKERILVTGGGSSVCKELKNILFDDKHADVTYVNKSDADLILQSDVNYIFQKYRPTRVIHLAAKVGGILDNIKNPLEFYDDNVHMNINMLSFSRLFGVKRFTGILSTCIYPKNPPSYPITEDMMHLGPPEDSNFGYGYAKRMMGVHIDLLNKTMPKGYRYNYIIPCNLYSKPSLDDNMESMHFINALLIKIIKAKLENKNEIELMGDGTPRRQFMYSGDLANIIFNIVKRDIAENFNVCPDYDMSINEIAEKILLATGNKHMKIKYDTSKPNGIIKKNVSNKKFKTLFPDYNFASLEYETRCMYNSLLKEIE